MPLQRKLRCRRGARFEPAAAVVNGKGYVIGGADFTGDFFRTNAEYTPHGDADEEVEKNLYLNADLHF